MAQRLKYSKQREALLTLLQSVTCHPDAEWLYNNLKNEYPKLSLATVYRNLGVLCAQGEAIKLDIGDGTVHYDATTTDHDHFFCKVCRSLSDLGTGDNSKLDRDLEREHGVTVDSHSFVFYGVCRECNKKRQNKV